MCLGKKRHLNLERHTKEKDFWTTTRQLTRLGKVWIDAMFDIYASWNRFSLRISELYPNTCNSSRSGWKEEEIRKSPDDSG